MTLRLCTHCGKPQINCDCHDDSGFAKYDQDAAAKKAGKVTSGDIRVALEGRYPAMSHALMFEVRDASGHAGCRSADAVAVGLWPSHGHKLEGIEIKISRGDFLHEMKHPEKSDPVMRYCHLWWLATPKGLVDPGELPPTWGLLELGEGGALRVKVKAPMLQERAQLDVSFAAAMLRRRAGKDHVAVQAAIAEGVRLARAGDAEELKRTLERERGHRAEEVVRGREHLKAIQEATGIDLTDYRAGEEIIEAVRIVRTLQQAKGAGWRNSLNTLRKSVDGMQKALAELGIEPD